MPGARKTQLPRTRKTPTETSSSIHNMLTTKELNNAACMCGSPDCRNDIIYFHSKCHPNHPAWVVFDKNVQGLVLTCAVCSEPIAIIKVADS